MAELDEGDREVGGKIEDGKTRLEMVDLMGGSDEHG